MCFHINYTYLLVLDVLTMTFHIGICSICESPDIYPFIFDNFVTETIVKAYSSRLQFRLQTTQNFYYPGIVAT